MLHVTNGKLYHYFSFCNALIICGQNFFANMFIICGWREYLVVVYLYMYIYIYYYSCMPGGDRLVKKAYAWASWLVWLRGIAYLHCMRVKHKRQYEKTQVHMYIYMHPHKHWTNLVAQSMACMQQIKRIGTSQLGPKTTCLLLSCVQYLKLLLPWIQK